MFTSRKTSTDAAHRSYTDGPLYRPRASGSFAKKLRVGWLSLLFEPGRSSNISRFIRRISERPALTEQWNAFRADVLTLIVEIRAKGKNRRALLLGKNLNRIV
jgi:hypothetical protein